MKQVPTFVEEYSWGCSFKENNVLHENYPFDIIFASDIAYEESLYDKIIDSLSLLSHEHTLIFIGISSCDTTPLFFQKLHMAKIRYERISDWQFGKEFRGFTFGIFL